MKQWIRAELRHWRSWRPWAVLFGLAAPAFVMSDLSASLGSVGLSTQLDEFLAKLLAGLCVLTVLISWGAGFTAAYFSRRFARLAMPILAAVAAYPFCNRIPGWLEYSGPARVAMGALGIFVLACLPAWLGWRMGSTAAMPSWRAMAAAAAALLLVSLLLWIYAGAHGEWAGLALTLLCSWPVVHAVAVSWRRPLSSQ